ncbi:MAG: acetyl-CoA carboxylase biotin carboxyl carrier protein [Beijerinckiaceae bacterium]
MTDKKSAAPDFPSAIDPGLVERLAEIASRLGLSEIEVAQGDLRIRVARQLAPVQVSVTSPAQAPALVAPAPQAVVAPPADHPGTVKSPMVGTAYRRPSPESPPFVEIGSQVKSGDKILLIEAMKTFNDIVAPRAGTVTAILIEDASPVEYGQPLVVIE